MSKISVKPLLNSRKDTSGERFTLVLQILYKRRRGVIFTPYKLLPAEFDSRKGAAVAVSRSRTHREFIDSVNAYLVRQIEEIGYIVRELEQSGKPFSAGQVVETYKHRCDNRFIDTYLQNLIRELEQQGDHGTAATFRSTLTTFKKFEAGRRYAFDHLDERLVLQLQMFLTQEQLRVNTITFYLCKLRAAYNKAVRQGYAPKEVDPFRNTSFRIEKTRKLAIDDSVLRKVAAADFPGHEELVVARDLFLFSFYTRGMSFVDMAYLRQSDIQGNVIRYRRRKTGQLFNVRIVPPLQEIIDLYREMCSPWVLPVMLHHCPDRSSQPYEFQGETHEKRLEYERILHKRYKNSRSHFLRLLRRVSNRLGLEQNLTFNMARHTWASRARKQNIPIAVISEGLGHTSEKTTRIYLDELEAERIDQANEIVTSF